MYDAEKTYDPDETTFFKPSEACVRVSARGSIVRSNTLRDYGSYGSSSLPVSRRVLLSPKKSSAAFS